MARLVAGIHHLDVFVSLILVIFELRGILLLRLLKRFIQTSFFRNSLLSQPSRCLTWLIYHLGWQFEFLNLLGVLHAELTIDIISLIPTKNLASLL